MTELDWSAGSGRVSAGGRLLEWSAWGDPPSESRPTIVMLHEGLGCVALWRDFPERVAQETGLSVLAYSRAGHGGSDPCDLPRPLDFMTAEAETVLADVLNVLGDGPVILLGHSDGATIAAEYAGRVADARVRGIILMAPHFFSEPMGLAEIADTAKAFAETDLKDRMAKYHADPSTTFPAWSGVWLDPGFVCWDVSDVIDFWRVPALVIQGRDDQYGTLAQVRVCEERSYAPVDAVVLDDCRHSPHADQPDKTLEAIAEFAARLIRIESAEVEPT